MTKEEVGKFSDKTPTINERTQITYKDNTIELGYFYNNRYSPTRKDNLWNFVIIAKDTKDNVNKVINGEDIQSIKIIQLY